MGPKPRNSGRVITNTNENPTENESNTPDSIQYITNSQLEKILADNRKENAKTIKDTINSEFSAMKKEIVRLQSELESVSAVASNALKLSEQLKKDFAKLAEMSISKRSYRIPSPTSSKPLKSSRKGKTDSSGRPSSLRESRSSQSKPATKRLHRAARIGMRQPPF